MNNNFRFDTKVYFDLGVGLLKRQIIIDQEIDDDFASFIVKSIEILTEVKKPIIVIINSPGGDIYAGLSIIDSLNIAKKRGCEIIIRVQGMCMSMASIILSIGDKRQATKLSQIMIHQGQHFIDGRFDETKIEMKQNIKLEKLCNTILSENCKQTIEEIEKVQEKGNYYMDAQKALKFGIIDEIV